MTALFATLYLDEDVSSLVADLVRARGYKVVTTGSANRLGSSDSDQLAYSTEQGYVLVTHNRVDFERLATVYFESGRNHAGIIVAVHRSPYELLRRLIHLLDNITPGEFSDQIRYI